MKKWLVWLRKNSNPISLVLLVVAIIFFVLGLTQSSEGNYENSSSWYQFSTSAAMISIGLTYLINEIRARKDRDKS